MMSTEGLLNPSGILSSLQTIPGASNSFLTAATSSILNAIPTRVAAMNPGTCDIEPRR